jgi:hypothetical protein
MSELRVSYGIPQPTDRIVGKPEFRKQGVTTLRLSDFPDHILPSGGMSNSISPSEMYMIQTCRPTDHTWINQSTGKVISKALNASYSFIGRFPWEITMPGIYECQVVYRGAYKGKVEFEVI